MIAPIATFGVSSPKECTSGIIGRLVNFDSSLTTAYLCALAFGILVYQSFEGLGLSTLITISVAIQCFGYTCLRLSISQRRSVAGISGQTLVLQAMSYGLRLCSTTWLKGYIPVDSTGEWLYQLLDVFALLMVLQIVYCIFRVYRHSYQEEHDACKIQPIAIGCFVFAALVHPDLNNRPVFDTLWATALYIDVVAMLPQLSMMVKVRGEVQALTSHFVGATAISRAVSLVFWYHGFAELAPLDGSFNFAGWTILAAHVVQMLLLCDFLYFYFRACLATGLCKPRLVLSPSVDV